VERRFCRLLPNVWQRCLRATFKRPTPNWSSFRIPAGYNAVSCSGQAVNNLGNIVGSYGITSHRAPQECFATGASPTATPLSQLAVPSGRDCAAIRSRCARQAHRGVRTGSHSLEPAVPLMHLPLAKSDCRRGITVRPFSPWLPRHQLCDTGQLVITSHRSGHAALHGAPTPQPQRVGLSRRFQGKTPPIGPTDKSLERNQTGKGLYTGPDVPKGAPFAWNDVIYPSTSRLRASLRRVPAGPRRRNFPATPRSGRR